MRLSIASRNVFEKKTHLINMPKVSGVARVIGSFFLKLYPTLRMDDEVETEFEAWHVCGGDYSRYSMHVNGVRNPSVQDTVIIRRFAVTKWAHSFTGALARNARGDGFAPQPQCYSDIHCSNQYNFSVISVNWNTITWLVVIRRWTE